MNEFDYETHLAQYRHLFNISADSRPEDVRNVEHLAQRAQALSVFGPLRDWQNNAIDISKRLKEDRARYHMKYCAGRRFGMMFYAYREIVFTVEPQRTDPLPHEDQQRLSLDINVLYLHTRGVLDNFAWAFLAETHPDKAAKVSPQQVSLFDPRFRAACPAFSTIAQQIDEHAGWMKDVKKRRDPVAHRIPLYIPQGALTPGEFNRYQELSQQHIDLTAEHKCEEAQKVFDAAGRLGRFVPCFLHSPDEKPIPIYPTVPTDMAHVIKIGKVIESGI